MQVRSSRRSPASLTGVVKAYRFIESLFCVGCGAAKADGPSAPPHLHAAAVHVHHRHHGRRERQQRRAHDAGRHILPGGEGGRAEAARSPCGLDAQGARDGWVG